MAEVIAELNGVPAGPDALRSLALVNYGHFTSMRVKDGQVRGLSHHLERLVRDCRALFGAELDRDQTRTYLAQALRGRHGTFTARITVFDPALDIGHPSVAGQPAILVTTRPATETPLPPMRVRPTEYVRDLPEVKHVGLFATLWHRRNAQLQYFDDAVFTDAEGYLSEGPTWNVGFYDGEQVIWPNAEVLPGITMRLIQQVHDRTVLAPVNRRDLPAMVAAFATNVSFGVRAISTIGNVDLSADHGIFDDLRKEYEEIPAEAL